MTVMVAGATPIVAVCVPALTATIAGGRWFFAWIPVLALWATLSGYLMGAFGGAGEH